MYAEIKRECGYLLAPGQELTNEGCQRVFDRYDMVTKIAKEIPEGEFLRQKQRHKIKIAVSRHLDTHPSASIVLTRLRLWYRDNFRSQGGQGS
jgi:hypothetical protein